MVHRPRIGQTSPRERLIRELTDPARRISLLIVVAYVSAIVGLALSIFGNAGDTVAVYSTAGIALMGLSFVSLFVVSVLILDLGPEPGR